MFGMRFISTRLFLLMCLLLFSGCTLGPGACQGEKSPGLNRLKDSKSPYLQQHADNPVDWYPWGQEALDRARKEDKPIFLSIGYSTCHWCHVMERESFMDPDVADLLNRHFVAIKVDREERPDIDRTYMQYLLAVCLAKSSFANQ